MVKEGLGSPALESCAWNTSMRGLGGCRTPNSELHRGTYNLPRAPNQRMVVTSGTDSGVEAWVEETWYGRVEGGSPDLESCQERPSKGSWGASWLARRPIRL